jgi:hypothetical protein
MQFFDSSAIDRRIHHEDTNEKLQPFPELLWHRRPFAVQHSHAHGVFDEQVHRQPLDRVPEGGLTAL